MVSEIKSSTLIFPDFKISMEFSMSVLYLFLFQDIGMNIHEYPELKFHLKLIDDNLKIIFHPQLQTNKSLI